MYEAEEKARAWYDRLSHLGRRGAKIAGSFILRYLIRAFGLPAVLGGAVLILGVLVLTSIFGAYPLEAGAAPRRADYAAAVQEFSPAVVSADKTESEHKLTWGLLYAVDYLTALSKGAVEPGFTGRETAKELAPRFEYRESTVTETTEETYTKEDGTEGTRTETRTYSVKLVTRADTYEGVYEYHYRTVTLQEGSTTIIKEVRDYVTFTPNWERLIGVLKERGAVEETETSEAQNTAALLAARAGQAFTAGQASLDWLGSEEDAWIFSATGGSFKSAPGLPPPSGNFIWPVRGTVTSNFGRRVDPVYGGYAFHKGIDIAVSQGTPVLASAAGIVRFAGVQGGFGLLVVIDHGGDVLSFYGHNMELKVRPGQRVEQGNVIALSGSTGKSTGPHVHFEIRVDGKAVDPVQFVSGQ